MIRKNFNITIFLFSWLVLIVVFKLMLMNLRADICFLFFQNFYFLSFQFSLVFIISLTKLKQKQN